MSSENNSAEINRMFDIAERRIMEYLCYFTGEDKEKLFKEDNMETISVLQIEYENTKMSLGIVDHDYKPNVSDEFKNKEQLKSCVEYFEFCVRQVFMAIIYNSLSEYGTKVMLLTSIHLELDPSNLTFKPIYIYPHRRQREILEKNKESLEKFYNERAQAEDGGWASLPADLQKDWEEKYSTTVTLLDGIICDGEQAFKEEAVKNKEFSSKKRLGIIFA